MKFLHRMLSSARDVSFGRVVSLACIVYVMGSSGYVMARMVQPAFPPIDVFWRDLILGLYMSTKAGDVAIAVAKKGAGDDAV